MGSLQVNTDTYVYHMLIGDADAVNYRAGFATKEGEPLSHAISNVRNILNEMRETCPAKSEVLYLTSNDKSNFRFDRATIPRIINKGKASEYELNGYKANRKDSRPPEHYTAIREYLVKEERAIIITGAEADDAMATMATYLLSKGLKSIISTHDKDLNMVPVDIHDMINKVIHPYDLDKHGIVGYNVLTDKRKLYGRGMAFFFAQMLMGDSGDNIPGIDGYGPVGAYKALKDCTTERDYFNKVWDIYFDYQNLVSGLSACKRYCVATEEDAKYRLMEVAALLWMQQHNLKDIEEYLEKEYFNEP